MQGDASKLYAFLQILTNIYLHYIVVDRVSIKVQSKIDKKYFRLGMFEAHNHDLHQSKDDSDVECTIGYNIKFYVL